jgi:hypothetical protein
MEKVELVANARYEYDDSILPETGEVFTEQRREPRHKLYNAVNVAFYNIGRLYRGYMVDLSAGGARLLLPVDLPMGIPDLSRSRKMECYLLNRYGSSKCRGTIQWIQNDGYLLKWGISFIEVSTDKDDPLRKIIGETFSTPVVVPVTGMAIY